MSEKLHPAEGINRPHWSRYRPQGKKRLLVRVYDKSEYKSSGGIVVPVDNIDQPHHGRVIDTSADFGDPKDVKVFGGTWPEVPFRFALKCLRRWNRLRYPGICKGANICVLPCSWITFQSLDDRLAWCSVDSLVGAYDWSGEDTVQKESVETRAAVDAHHDRLRAGLVKAADNLPDRDIPSIIRVV